MASGSTKTPSQWTQGEIDTIDSDNKTLSALVGQNNKGKSVEPDPQFPATPNPKGDLPDTAAATAGASDTQAGILTPQGKQPGSTQLDINKVLQPYIDEMSKLGPEYQEEMDFLKPYLEGTGAQAPQTFQQIEAGSKADETPTGSAKVNEADEAAGTAAADQKAPGFGALAQAGKEYEGTLPYSDILQTVLGAGKNEILYGSTPNLSAVSTAGWPASVKAAYDASISGTGVNPTTGLVAPTVAANTAPGAATGSTPNADGVFSDTSGVSGGGSTG